MNVRILTSLMLGLVALPMPVHAQQLSLSGALESAFETHPAVVRAAALEASAEESVTSARGPRWPSVNLQSGLTRFQEPMLATPLHAFDPTLLPAFDRTLLQSQVMARYTIVDWGTRAGSLGIAAGQRAAVAAATRATEAALIEQVADAYLRTGAARAVDAAAVARVTALRAERDRVANGLAAGTAAEVDLLRASVALRDAEANRTTTLGNVVLAERTLARLTGATPDLISAATLDDTPTVARVNREPASTVSPFVEEAGRQADVARARLLAERAPRLPRLDVNAGLLQYGTLALAPVVEWQAGLSVSWQIFSGGTRSSSIRRAEADLRAAESQVTARELEVATAVDAAHAAIDAADARVEALTASVGQWEELMRIEILALEAGSGTQRDRLDAEAGLYQARAGLVEATTAAYLARVRLARAEGVLDMNWILQTTGGA
jgi:outer membrane protein TolC